MGLGIMWVMKPREREMFPNQREGKFQIREIRAGCWARRLFIGFKFRFLCF